MENRMQVSEAILLGSTMLKPVPYIRNDGSGGGCALGMAEIAVDGAESGIERTAMGKWLLGISLFPCVCGLISPYNVLIAHIFNEHVCKDKTWTIEKLVDWVRSVEPKEEVKAESDKNLDTSVVEELHFK